MKGTTKEKKNSKKSNKKNSHLLLDLDGSVPALKLARDAGLFDVEQRQLLDVEFLFVGNRKREREREKRKRASCLVRGGGRKKEKKTKHAFAFFVLLQNSSSYLLGGHGDFGGLLLGLLPDEPDHLVDLALDLGERVGGGWREKMRGVSER